MDLAGTSPAEPPALIADAALLAKHRPGVPCYALYPTSDHFDAAYRPIDALRALADRAGAEPVSIVVRLPHFDSASGAGTCGTAAVEDRTRVPEYLGHLEREIVTQCGALRADATVCRIRLGGASTHLLVDELPALMDVLHRYFAFEADADASASIDPRHGNARTVELLATLGFNCLSLGAQEFDPEVRRKVGGLPALDDTARAMLAARTAGFRSVGVDLACGLPSQSPGGMARTLETVLDLRPDRVTLRQCPHAPRRGAGEWPAPEETIRMIAGVAEALTSAGYRYLGIGRFALAEDALRAGGARGDRLAFGVSAIAAVGNSYSRNHRSLEEYCASLERGELPVCSGLQLDADDLVRRDTIRRLSRDFHVSYREFRARHGVEFPEYYGREQAALSEFERDGMLERDGGGVRVTPRGRLAAGAICAVFDRYLHAGASAPHAPAPVRQSR